VWALNVATAKGQPLAALGNVQPVGNIVHTPGFQRFAFAIPDQNGGVGGDIRVVDVKQSQALPQIRGLRPTPKRLALTADGRRVAAAGEGESPPVTVWDVATGRQLKSFTGLRGQATGLEFTPDGK